MKITAQQLRKIIREEIERFGEAYTPWTPQDLVDYVIENIRTQAPDVSPGFVDDLVDKLNELRGQNPERVKRLLDINGLGSLYTSWLDTPSRKLSRR